MKRQPIFLISLALSLFLIGLLLAEGTRAAGPTLRITIAPRTGPPGTAIGVTGEGAQTDKLVKVVFATSGEGGTSLAEVEVPPQADGTFTAAITVPDGTVGGTYAVRAEQTNPATGGLIHYWYNSFVVTGAAAATATPETAAPTEAAATTEATAPVVPTVTAEPTVSATGTITATETITPAATTAATLTPPGEMPTTGEQSSESNNTAVIVIVVLATLGILAAFGAGFRQARKT